MKKAYKIKISSVTESKIAQDYLYSLGYDWYVPSKERYINVYKPYLFSGEEGEILFGNHNYDWDNDSTEELKIVKIIRRTDKYDIYGKKI